MDRALQYDSVQWAMAALENENGSRNPDVAVCYYWHPDVIAVDGLLWHDLRHDFSAATADRHWC